METEICKIVHLCLIISAVISTNCPEECPSLTADIATAGAQADYTLQSTTVSFPGINTVTVPITIHNDEVEEHREYFCLQIVNTAERGDQWYTRVIIPWNDRKYHLRMVPPSKNCSFL